MSSHPQILTNQWLLPTCIAFLLSCALLTGVTGQGQEDELFGDEDWPVVIDPFPESDEIGPEPPPTEPPPPDCTLACQEKIDETNSFINQLQQQLTDTNATLFARLLAIEASGNGGGGDVGDLPVRVTNLEAYLPANITSLIDKFNTDVGILRTQLSGDLSNLKQELETKISNIPTGGGGGGDGGEKAMEVYSNLTQRINVLETGKIQNLITDNQLWRQNFRVVNATFAKLRKSTRGNNVIITG